MKFLQKIRVEFAANKLAFVAANFGLTIAAVGPAWVPDRAIADSGAVTISGSVKPKVGTVSANAAVVDEKGRIVLRAVNRAAEKSKGKDSDDEPTAADDDSVLLIESGPRKKEFSSRMPLIHPLYCRP